MYVLVGGDLNIDLLMSDITHPETVNIFRSYNYLPYITKPTRVTNTSATCIDHFWYNNYNVEFSGVFHEYDTSDHHTIFIFLKFVADKSPLMKQFTDHSQHCMLQLMDEMSSFVDVTHCRFSVSMDVHEKCEFLIQQFYEIYNKCCPIRSKQISLKYFKNPWIDSVLASSIKEMFSLFKKLQERH